MILFPTWKIIHDRCKTAICHCSDLQQSTGQVLCGYAMIVHTVPCVPAKCVDQLYFDRKSHRQRLLSAKKKHLIVHVEKTWKEKQSKTGEKKNRRIQVHRLEM